MSADQRPAETAAHDWRVSEAAADAARLCQPTSEHAKAMAAPAAADRTDSRPEPVSLPPVPDGASKHTGPPA